MAGRICVRLCSAPESEAIKASAIPRICSAKVHSNCGNLRSDPNASVPGGDPQSSSFEEAAYIKTIPERAYGKAQSHVGDASTVFEIVSVFLLFRVSVSLEQCVFMQDGK